MNYTYNYLYVLGCDNNKYVKIGVCKTEKQLQKRIKTLQTGNPKKIDVLFCEDRPNATKAEIYLHRCFQDKQAEGEWFEGITLKDIRVKLMLFLEQV